MSNKARDHRAVIVLDADELERLFDLPPGLEVQGVYAEPHRLAISVLICDRNAGTLNQQLGYVDPGTIAPEFPPLGQLVREHYSVLQEDGTSKLYVRFGWEATDA